MAEIKRVEVYRQAFALLASGNVNVDIPKDRMPSGLIHGYTVRLESGSIPGFTSAATSWQQVLRSITYGAAIPNFSPMVGVPGLAWDRYQTLLNNKASARVTPNASGFMYQTYLPFSWRGAKLNPYLRPKDSALLNIKNMAAPTINLQLGAYTDLSGGATGCTVTVIVVAHYEEAPQPGVPGIGSGASGGGDQPTMALELSFKQKSDMSTNPIANLLAGGGRFNLGIGARELTSAGAEASNTFTVANGTGTPSKFEILKGASNNYTPRMKVCMLDSLAEDYFGAAPNAGLHLWLASMNELGKLEEKGADSIPLDDTFQVIMDNILTTTNVLEIFQPNHIQLPPDILAQHAEWLKAAK